MKKPTTLQDAVAAARKRGATDFNKDYRGKLLISFSCVEDGKRYAYFHDEGCQQLKKVYASVNFSRLSHETRVKCVAGKPATVLSTASYAGC